MHGHATENISAAACGLWWCQPQPRAELRTALELPEVTYSTDVCAGSPIGALIGIKGGKCRTAKSWFEAISTPAPSAHRSHSAAVTPRAGAM